MDFVWDFDDTSKISSCIIISRHRFSSLILLIEKACWLPKTGLWFFSPFVVARYPSLVVKVLSEQHTRSQTKQDWRVSLWRCILAIPARVYASTPLRLYITTACITRNVLTVYLFRYNFQSSLSICSNSIYTELGCAG